MTPIATDDGLIGMRSGSFSTVRKTHGCGFDAEVIAFEVPFRKLPGLQISADELVHTFALVVDGSQIRLKTRSDNPSNAILVDIFQALKRSMPQITANNADRHSVGRGSKFHTVKPRLDHVKGRIITRTNKLKT